LIQKFTQHPLKNYHTHVVNALAGNHGWRFTRKLHGLPGVMRYRKPFFAIDNHAGEISRYGAGANERSEKRIMYFFGRYAVTILLKNCPFCSRGGGACSSNIASVLSSQCLAPPRSDAPIFFYVKVILYSLALNCQADNH